MKVDRSQVVDLLRVRGEDHKVTDAERELPVEVDTERDREVLARLGLDEQAIRGGLENGPDQEGSGGFGL